MDYTTLKTDIADTVENTFQADDYSRFAQLAEVYIYNMVQPPAFRKNCTASLTASNQYLTVPTDFLYVHSLAVVNPTTSKFSYPIEKDVNFIREAYPNPASTGQPKHYALFSENSFIVGPTPDANYAVELHYGYYPETIVTAGTTWLSTNFYNTLLNACLVEAGRMLKFEEDVMTLYQGELAKSISLMKNLMDGKMRQDSYRTGQVKVEVT